MSYSLLLVLQRAELIAGSWLRSYAADLLCMPLVLIITSLCLRKLKGIEQLSIAHIVFAWAYMSIAFEWVLPQLASRYTGDVLDVFCYGMGTVIFYVLRQYIFHSDPQRPKNYKARPIKPSSRFNMR